MRIGTTKPATCAPIKMPKAWGATVSVIAMIAAVIAKLVAQTALSTTLMCAKSGVSQNSRGATRFANVTVNGRVTTIDTAAATASVAGMSAGTYWCSTVAGSAYATALNAAKNT